MIVDDAVIEFQAGTLHVGWFVQGARVVDPRVLVIVAETEVDKVTVVEEVVVILQLFEVGRGCRCQGRGSEEYYEALHRGVDSLACQNEIHS